MCGDWRLKEDDLHVESRESATARERHEGRPAVWTRGNALTTLSPGWVAPQGPQTGRLTTRLEHICRQAGTYTYSTPSTVQYLTFRSEVRWYCAAVPWGFRS